MVRVFVLLMSMAVAAPASAASGSEPIAARGGAKRKRSKQKLDYRPNSNAVVDVFNQGIEAFNGADPKEAAAKFRQVLAQQPTCGLAMVLLGRSLLRQSETKEAIAVLTEATQLFAYREEPWSALSDAWFAQGDFEAALSVAEQGLVERPESLQVLESLSIAAIRLGRYDLALNRFRARRLRGPNKDLECLEVTVRVEMEDLAATKRAWAKCEGGSERLVAYAKARIEGEVDDDELAASRRLEAIGVAGAGDLSDAIEAYNAGDFRLAGAILDKLLAKHPEHVQPRVARARTRAALDDPDGALADLELALKAEDWIQVSQSGAVSGVLTKRGEENLLESLMQGSALMVRLMAIKGRTEEARAQLAKAREAFGEQPEFVAAESRIVLAEGGKNRWSAMADLLLAHPEDREVQLDAADLVFEHGGAAPDAILHPLRDASEPAALYNTAIGLSNAKRWGRCLEFSQLHLARADQLQAGGAKSDAAKVAFGQVEVMQELGYVCALHEQQFDDARELLGRIGPAKIDVRNASAHVSKLAAAKRPKDAWAVLQETKLLKRDPTWATQMAIRLQIELGDLDQALKLARAPHAGAIERFMLSTDLYEAGRPADALEMLEAACPDLTGQNKDACENNLQILRQTE